MNKMPRVRVLKRRSLFSGVLTVHDDKAKRQPQAAERVWLHPVRLRAKKSDVDTLLAKLTAKSLLAIS